VWQPCENLSIDLTTVPAGPVVVKDGWEGTHELLRPAVATPAQVAAPSAEAGAEPIAAVEAAPAAEVKDSPTATIAEQEVKAAVALAAAAEVLAVAAASMDEDVIMAAAKAAAAASSTSSAAAGSAQAEALRSKSEVRHRDLHSEGMVTIARASNARVQILCTTEPTSPTPSVFGVGQRSWLEHATASTGMRFFLLRHLLQGSSPRSSTSSKGPKSAKGERA
jgi:hypothetical protein